MPELAAFDAALLAGGRSSRFGSDKAFLDWQGMPLYVNQLRKLASLSPGQLWLSTRADQPFPDVLSAVTRLVDQRPDLGPIGGLHSILRSSRAERVLVLAVDLPRMEAEFLAQLLSGNAGRAPISSQTWEPLAAVYPREKMLTLVEAAISKGDYRLQNLLNHAAEAGWLEAWPITEKEAAFFTNLNTPDDLALIQQGLHDESTLLHRYRYGQGFTQTPDFLASEEPLEIRVNGNSVAVTMRTPGHDEDLATGFLFTEGILREATEIVEFVRCRDVDAAFSGGILDLRLRSTPDLSRLTRHLFTSSSCGVCGKATLDAVFGQFPPIASPESHIHLTADQLLSLPEQLRRAQSTFDRTGGLHASALFDTSGQLLLAREDVGRHNALDKVIGHALRSGIDLADTALLVSGRISFELMQKALAARISLVAGISAPSSLAVSLARRSGQTLVGFLRGEGFNLYTGSCESLNHGRNEKHGSV